MSNVKRSTVAVVEEYRREAEALSEKIHALWEELPNMTDEKVGVGTARDRAVEAASFLKDVATLLARSHAESSS